MHRPAVPVPTNGAIDEWQQISVFMPQRPADEWGRRKPRGDQFKIGPTSLHIIIDVFNSDAPIESLGAVEFFGRVPRDEEAAPVCVWAAERLESEPSEGVAWILVQEHEPDVNAERWTPDLGRRRQICIAPGVEVSDWFAAVREAWDEAHHAIAVVVGQYVAGCEDDVPAHQHTCADLFDELKTTVCSAGPALDLPDTTGGVKGHV